MNRVVHTHFKSPVPPIPNDPVFLGSASRPNARFGELSRIAGIRLKSSIDSGADQPWRLKDLRNTCATYYDEHTLESSVEILGHSAGRITYRHYAHRAPLALKAIMTLLQPAAFMTLVKGHEGECPCCRRPFPDVR